jgi:uncharacterized protein
MADCCGSEGHEKQKKDWLWITVLSVSFVALIVFIFNIELPFKLDTVSKNIIVLLKEMWIGILFGIIAIGILDKVPKEFIHKMVFSKTKLGRIFKATVAGLFLDLCSHGILLVGLKLYKKGMTIGQLMAFLIASPWNSFSLTLVLFSLIGLKWTLAFIGLSLLIAFITGYIFEILVDKKIIKGNPVELKEDPNFNFSVEAKKEFSKISWTFGTFWRVIKTGVGEAKFIVRWLLLGTLIASAIQTYISTDIFQDYFGASLLGLGLTLLSATIIEVCSEGSAPIAADLLNRALAPGNAFTFLMAGAATDYTEILGIKETTKSWKIAFLLPILTVPQVLILGYLLNQV